MSATSFQRKRRELREQTSVSARMNEEGQYDPYAKSDANYDQVGVKDMGTVHQEGDPPPFSLTPHRPEELHQASKLHDPDDPSSYEAEVDEGERQQAEGAPETSVEIRGGYVPGVEGDEREDQAQYAHLDKREEPTMQASLANVDLSEPGVNATEAAERKAGEMGVDLATVEGSGSGGRVTVGDVEAAASGGA